MVSPRTVFHPGESLAAALSHRPPMVTLLVTRHFLDSSGRRDMDHTLDYRITPLSSRAARRGGTLDGARARMAQLMHFVERSTGARARHPLCGGFGIVEMDVRIGGDVRILLRHDVVASEDRIGRTGSMSRAGP